jgi:hypothetical protein
MKSSQGISTTWQFSLLLFPLFSFASVIIFVLGSAYFHDINTTIRHIRCYFTLIYNLSLYIILIYLN